jgi:hypothetical protein
MAYVTAARGLEDHILDCADPSCLREENHDEELTKSGHSLDESESRVRV